MADFRELSIQNFLVLKNEAQSVRDQLLTHHLTVLDSTDTLEVALRKFNGGKIVSAPVKMPNGSYKFLSDMDILAAINDINSDIIWDTPIERFCNISGQSDYSSIHVDKSMAEAIQLLSQKHRILVINDQGQPINILGHMDIVAFLSHHMKYIPDHLMHVPVGHVMVPNPLCVRFTDQTYNSMLLCLKNQYYGIGVVDDAGILKANISISSIKDLNPQNFLRLLRSPVQKYLEETQSQYLLKAPVTCKYNDLFGNVVKMINNNHVHRIYAVDDQGRPQGVISTSDIMKALNDAIATRK